jgi:hypothetical protein
LNSNILGVDRAIDERGLNPSQLVVSRLGERDSNGRMEHFDSIFLMWA